MLTTYLVNAYEHALVQLHVCGLGFYADATFEEGAAVLSEFHVFLHVLLCCHFFLLGFLCFRWFSCVFMYSRLFSDVNVCITNFCLSVSSICFGSLR